MTLVEFVQQTINGLATGGVYALIALGYTMVYGVMKLINFAHGDLFAFGAYLGFTALFTWGFADRLDLASALLLTLAVVVTLCALAGGLLERVAYRPLRGSNRLSAVVSAMGASIFIQNAIMLVWGGSPLSYRAGLVPDATWSLGDATIPVKSVAVVVVSVLVMLGLQSFIHRTRTGLAIRASAIDQDAARLMGVDVRRVVVIVFLIGPALGGFAGLLIGLQYGLIDFGMGQIFGLKAFTAAILGGIGNIPGAMVGGLLLGLLEAYATAAGLSAWRDAIIFAALILILVIRPTGLFRERVAEKL